MSAGLTVGAAIEAGEQQLEQAQFAGQIGFGHGTTNAYDEAAWLVLWRLSLPLDDLDGVINQELNAEQWRACQDLIAERIRTQKPAAYLTHEAWLQGVSFYIDERSIVPRSFIAELIADGSLEPWLPENPYRVLDLCTGNASLAILMALYDDAAQILASDLSLEALEVAKINVHRYALEPRIELVHSDGLDQVPGVFDLVLCNPPYVNAQSMQALPNEYRAEPVLALAGGADGMDFIRQLLKQLPAHLSQDGVLLLEIGNERAHFEAAFPHLDPVWLPTSAGEDQVLLIEARHLYPEKLA